MGAKKEWFSKEYIDKIVLGLINIGCIISLVIVIFPLLLVAKYNYPSADDWTYGVKGYRVLKAGGGFLQVLCAAAQRAKDAYFGWDGRFANSFINSLQPGIWGEQYYVLTSWILIGMLIVSEMIFLRFIIYFGDVDKRNVWLWIPVVIPVLIIQILYTPAIVESFYWYTGAMDYSFMYGLSLILMVVFIKLGMQEYGIKGWRVLLSVIAFVLSIFVGGSNFSTSLSTVLAAFIITIVFIFQKNYSFLKNTWFVTLTLTICLGVCLISPGSVKGNAARMTKMGNPLPAVGKTLFISVNNVHNWTITVGVLLMLLFVFPFIWRAAENSKFSFRYPLLFSVLTFGIYASQLMPDVYVTGGPVGGRQSAIFYYSYFIWLIVNIYYWIGWLRRKLFGWKIVGWGQENRFLFVYCSVIGIALISFICIFDKKGVSSYKAYRDWRQGWAQQYADEWKSRLEILHDDNIKQVEFMPLQAHPETIWYTDLEEDENSSIYWVNSACATYYDKEYIHISK